MYIYINSSYHTTCTVQELFRLLRQDVNLPRYSDGWVPIKVSASVIDIILWVRDTRYIYIHIIVCHEYGPGSCETFFVHIGWLTGSVQNNFVDCSDILFAYIDTHMYIYIHTNWINIYIYIRLQFIPDKHIYIYAYIVYTKRERYIYIYIVVLDHVYTLGPLGTSWAMCYKNAPGQICLWPDLYCCKLRTSELHSVPGNGWDLSIYRSAYIYILFNSVCVYMYNVLNKQHHERYIYIYT